MTRRFRWALAAIAAAAFALTLLRLGHFSYGLDEVMQVFFQGGDWRFLWHSLTFDAVHPPLDFVFGKLFESLHPSDAARLLLPALWGAGGVAALGAFIARRAGATTGLVAAALLALAPYHVRFSQELRPYSLGLFLMTLALLGLELFLARPGPARLGVLFLAFLATAYTLYAAALVLGLAAAALLVEDAFAADADRRRTARRSLAASPLFLAALAAAYLPWWPVVLTAMRRPLLAAASPLTWDRAAKSLSFFAFAPDDGVRLGFGGGLFLLLAAGGAWIAATRPRLRFLSAWALGGIAAIEALSRLRPNFDASRRFLPVGPALTALAAVSIAALLARPVTRLLGAATLAAVLVLDARGLRVYFREGRPDWRPLAEYLRREGTAQDRVFAENPHTQRCVAFYLAGPRWLADSAAGRDPGRSVVNVGDSMAGLIQGYRPGTRAWLVLAAGPENPDLRRWSEPLPSQSFPRALGAIVRRIDPAGPVGR